MHAKAGLPVAVTAAASEGDAQAVAAWLNEGGGVDARCAGRYGETLLMGVAAGGQEAMMRMLLQRGASVNLQNSLGDTALMDAAANGHTTIVQALLDAKADASLQATGGGTALMAAEHQKHTAAAQLLRQHAKRQTAEADAAVMRAAASAPTPCLLGRRVSIDGLKGRSKLNGQCGVAGRFDAAKGGYEVVVEGEAEAVLLRPANLQEIRANPNPNTNPDPDPDPNRNRNRNPNPNPNPNPDPNPNPNPNPKP
jgi:ankyrin repeat protein